MFNILPIYNPGVLESRIPNHIFERLKSDCLSGVAKKDTYNHNLISYIREEYQYDHHSDLELSNFLLEMYRSWRNTFSVDPDHELRDNQYPVINDIWINYQKKGEYNPNHIHGGKASFVIWVNIPYDIDEELKVDFHEKPQTPRVAAFELTYSTHTMGLSSHLIWVNKRDEGRIIMFPANMTHCVYPFFTSDETRISVAGNMNIVTGE